MNPKYEINDVRTNFKATFSGYNRNNVRNELVESVIAGRYDAASAWGAELLCSGFMRDIWDAILELTSQHVYIANPKLPIYVQNRYKLFQMVMKNHTVDLDARNDVKVREVFAELLYVLSNARKRPKLLTIKMPDEAFNVSLMVLKAPSIRYARSVFRNTDPQELFAPTNELVYYLSEGDTLKACYWLEWILFFEQRKQKLKEPFRCATRTVPPHVHDKFSGDVSWLIWQVLRNEAASREPPLIPKIVEALFALFHARYSSSTSRKLRCIYYHCCHLLTTPIEVDIPIVSDTLQMAAAVRSVNGMYAQLKKNECQGNVEYLKKII